MRNLLQKLPLAMGLAFLAVGLTAGVGSAQYPPPSGSVTLTAQGSAVTGDTVSVVAGVRDANGAAVSGIGCTFNIGSQPGSDASIERGPFTTDAAGNASSTLTTGSTPGQIVVETLCGTFSGRITMTVAGSAGAAELPSALPATGIVDAADSSGLINVNALGVASLALMLLGGVMVGVGVISRRRS